MRLRLHLPALLLAALCAAAGLAWAAEASPTAPAPPALSAAEQKAAAAILARLEAAQRALRQAADDLAKASTGNKGGYIELARTSTARAQALVAEALARQRVTPETVLLARDGATLAAGGGVVPVPLPASTSLSPNGSPNVVAAINALNTAVEAFFSPQPPDKLRTYFIGGLGGLRDKILAETSRAATEAGAAIEVAARVRPALPAAVPSSPRPVPAPPPAPVPPVGPAPRATFTGAVAFGPQEWRSDEAMHQFFVDWFIRVDGSNPFASKSPGGIPLDDRMRLIVPGSGLLGGASARRPREYKLDRLELIGIARHDPPVALAISFHRPGPATAAPTRVLTEFEQTSLASLRREGGAVIADDGVQRLLVGPIHARAECLSCHTGFKAGDLLGAFSYRLSAAPSPVP